ncbi:thymidylate synthase [Shewanella phage vB_SbaS_Y11]|nr:thymidylate synthase [Shewanella phage vB_SbaS_Y11]
MNDADKAYIALCQKIVTEGNDKEDRTNTGTKSLFAEQIKFDLSKGFPLLTTKKVHFKSVVGELLWFLRGDTNIKFLQDNGIKIWDAWATDEGEIGKMYGAQWRKWNYVSKPVGGGEKLYTGETDQIGRLIEDLKFNPDSRRHVVSAWNVGDLPDDNLSPKKNAECEYMALAPCHYSFQCYVNDGKLSMLVNQRSADIFLGVPFNIASYALLTHMLAQVCGLEVGELIWSGGDCHIYSNHLDQITEQVRRFEAGEVYELPTLWLNPRITDIDDFTFDDIGLIDYKSGSAIPAPVAV